MLIFLSLGLLVWTSGQMSLCHAAFAAVGAAAFGQLTSQLRRALAAGARAGRPRHRPGRALVAVPAIRLSGLYLALATFGFGILVEQVVYPAEFLFGAIGGTPAGAPARRQLAVAATQGYYYVVLAVAVARLPCWCWAVSHSRLGRLLRGLADSPPALTTMGTTVNVTRVLVFCLSAFLAGVAGGLFGAAVGTVDAASASVPSSRSPG